MTIMPHFRFTYLNGKNIENKCKKYTELSILLYNFCKLVVTNWLFRNCTFLIVSMSWILCWYVSSILHYGELMKSNCILILSEASRNRNNFNQPWWLSAEKSSSRKTFRIKNLLRELVFCSLIFSNNLTSHIASYKKRYRSNSVCFK